jgi:hypothetical protein
VFDVVNDVNDLYPLDASESKDSDGDGVGDNADAFPNDASPDIDNDGVLNAQDAFPLDASESKDSDGDGTGDNSDNCSGLANASQSDIDGDGEGDACDDDDDSDGLRDVADAFPLDVFKQVDPDSDGLGDACDGDGLGDGLRYVSGAFPPDVSEQVDPDGDGIGDTSDVYPKSEIVRGYQFLQTSSTSANVTSLHVLNTSDGEQSFSALMFDGTGDRVGGTPLIGGPVPPMGRIVLTSEDIEDLFNTEPWKGPAVLQIRGESTFDVMSKLLSPSGLVSNTNCVREDQLLNIEGFDSNNMSYVGLTNTLNSNSGEITGTLYDANGNVVGNANSLLALNLAPNQQIWETRFTSSKASPFHSAPTRFAKSSRVTQICWFGARFNANKLLALPTTLPLAS